MSYKRSILSLISILTLIFPFSFAYLICDFIQPPITANTYEASESYEFKINIAKGEIYIPYYRGDEHYPARGFQVKVNEHGTELLSLYKEGKSELTYLFDFYWGHGDEDDQDRNPEIYHAEIATAPTVLLSISNILFPKFEPIEPSGKIIDDQTAIASRPVSLILTPNSHLQETTTEVILDEKPLNLANKELDIELSTPKTYSIKGTFNNNTSSFTFALSSDSPQATLNPLENSYTDRYLGHFGDENDNPIDPLKLIYISRFSSQITFSYSTVFNIRDPNTGIKTISFGEFDNTNTGTNKPIPNPQSLFSNGHYKFNISSLLSSLDSEQYFLIKKDFDKDEIKPIIPNHHDFGLTPFGKGVAAEANKIFDYQMPGLRKLNQIQIKSLIDSINALQPPKEINFLPLLIIIAVLLIIGALSSGAIYIKKRTSSSNF